MADSARELEGETLAEQIAETIFRHWPHLSASAVEVSNGSFEVVLPGEYRLLIEADDADDPVSKFDLELEDVGESPATTAWVQKNVTIGQLQDKLGANIDWRLRARLNAYAKQMQTTGKQWTVFRNASRQILRLFNAETGGKLSAYKDAVVSFVLEEGEQYLALDDQGNWDILHVHSVEKDGSVASLGYRKTFTLDSVMRDIVHAVRIAPPDWFIELDIGVSETTGEVESNPLADLGSVANEDDLGVSSIELEMKNLDRGIH